MAERDDARDHKVRPFEMAGSFQQMPTQISHSVDQPLQQLGQAIQGPLSSPMQSLPEDG